MPPTLCWLAQFVAALWTRTAQSSVWKQLVLQRHFKVNISSRLQNGYERKQKVRSVFRRRLPKPWTLATRICFQSFTFFSKCWWHCQSACRHPKDDSLRYVGWKLGSDRPHAKKGLLGLALLMTHRGIFLDVSRAIEPFAHGGKCRLLFSMYAWLSKIEQNPSNQGVFLFLLSQRCLVINMPLFSNMLTYDLSICL